MALQSNEEGGGVSSQRVQRKLPREVQARMVTLHAQFQSLSAIRKAIAAEFGLELDERTIAHYDAGKPKARVGQRLRELYASAREAYVGEQANVAISHQNHRLRLIERAIAGAEKGRDWGAVTKLLELAAKEMGGVLTNVSKVEHKGGIEHRHMSMDDARAELALRLSHALDGGVLKPQQIEAKPLDLQGNPEDLT